MAINVVKDVVEEVVELYTKVEKLFREDGNPKRQIMFQITNRTDRTLQLAGTAIGAGVIASSGSEVWRAPFQLGPGQVTLIPVESSGGSSQCCFSYGFQLKKGDSNSAFANLLLYAYNPKIGYNYGGMYNVSEGEFITSPDFKEAMNNKGLYPGNTLCSIATKGVGPAWQVNASHYPIETYHFNEEWLLRRTATRQTIQGKLDVSVLRIDYSFESSQEELAKINERIYPGAKPKSTTNPKTF